MRLKTLAMWDCYANHTLCSSIFHHLQSVHLLHRLNWCIAWLYTHRAFIALTVTGCVVNPPTHRPTIYSWSWNDLHGDMRFWSYQPILVVKYKYGNNNIYGCVECQLSEQNLILHRYVHLKLTNLVANKSGFLRHIHTWLHMQLFVCIWFSNGYPAH